MNTCHCTRVQTHRLYNSRSEYCCELWILGDRCVNTDLSTGMNVPVWWGILKMAKTIPVGVEGAWKISVPSQFCYEPKTALKNFLWTKKCFSNLDLICISFRFPLVILHCSVGRNFRNYTLFGRKIKSLSLVSAKRLSLCTKVTVGLIDTNVWSLSGVVPSCWRSNANDTNAGSQASRIASFVLSLNKSSITAAATLLCAQTRSSKLLHSDPQSNFLK